MIRYVDNLADNLIVSVANANESGDRLRVRLEYFQWRRGVELEGESCARIPCEIAVVAVLDDP